MAANTAFSELQQATLLQVARTAIVHGLEWQRTPPLESDRFEQALREFRASFVTLRHGDRLRGCIGSLEARRALVVDVAENAFAAAFRDPRFEPLSRAELPGLDIHLSILNPSEPLEFQDEADLLRKLRPGVDGLTIARGKARATFLPAVWESLPEPGQFLRHLKLKAGLLDVDTDSLRVWRYTATSIPLAKEPPASCA